MKYLSAAEEPAPRWLAERSDSTPRYPSRPRSSREKSTSRARKNHLTGNQARSQLLAISFFQTRLLSLPSSPSPLHPPRAGVFRPRHKLAGNLNSPVGGPWTADTRTTRSLVRLSRVSFMLGLIFEGTRGSVSAACDSTVRVPEL